MCLFSKKEYKEVYFPFVLITNLQEYDESEESGIFDIEANGIIDGKQMYLFASLYLRIVICTKMVIMNGLLNV